MSYDGTLNFNTSMDASGFQKGANSLKDIVGGLGVFKILEKGLQAVTEQIGAAVSRFDTLERFPRVMEQMGFSAESTSKSMSKLSDGVMGLPTALDDVVKTTQRIASMTGDLEGAADTTLALNNAFLASGATADAASRGMEQYMQIIGRGKPEMEDWKTLQETMPYALQKVAEAFGYTGTSATRDFYSALSEGIVTVDQMNAKFIELSQGADGFAATAKTAVGGIGTAMTNFTQAITRGLVNVISSINEGLSTTKFKSIENIIVSAGKGIYSALTVAAKGASFVAKNIGTITTATVAFVAAWKTAKFLSLAGQMGSLSKAALAMAPAILKVVAAKALDAKQTIVINALYAKDAIVKAASTVATLAQAAAEKIRTAATLDYAKAGALSTTATGMGVAATIAHTAATALATAAQWALNIALNANPIGLVVMATVGAVAAVAALAAGIYALVKSLNSESEAYSEQKKELESLKEEHEQYLEQSAQDQADAEKKIQSAKVQAEANNTLIRSLNELISTNDKAGTNNAAIQQTVDQLNNSVDGLSLTYDENTNALSANIDELENYINAKNEISVYQAQEEEYNRLLSERAQIQAKINIEEERLKSLEEQLDQKLITEREYNNLVKETEDLLNDYGEAEEKLAKDVDAASRAIANSTEDMSRKTINKFEAMNGAVDEEGRNIMLLAEIYGTSAEDIIAAMDETGQSLAEWSADQEGMFTKSGQSLSGVATQWGMTSEEVKGYMSDWGMNLDDFAKHMESTHTSSGLSLEDLAAKWGTTTAAIKTEMDNMGLSMQEWSDRQDQAFQDYEDSIKEHTSNVVNGFKEIPGQYEQSAEEMLQILITNKERYAEWELTMEEVTRQLGPTAAEEFGKLGPSATSAMQDILNSTELMNQYRDVFGVKLDEATGIAVEKWSDPNFIGQPAQAMNQMAASVTADTSLSTAMDQKAIDLGNKFVALQDTAGSVDFSAVATNLADSISGADIDGAMGTVTTSIQNNQGNIASAVSTISEAVTAEFETMGSDGVSEVENMMTQIGSTMLAKMSVITGYATDIKDGVVNALADMVDSAVTVTENMMAGIAAAMEENAQGLYTKANEIATNIANTMAKALQVESPSKVMKRIFGYVMDGVWIGMDDKAGYVYSKAASISTGIADKLTISPDTLSNIGALSMTRSVGSQPYSLAMAAGGGAGSVTYTTNLTQNITTPKPLSASEMTREGQDMLKRSRWQLP